MRRAQFRRKGNFWTEGDPLTEEDRRLLWPLIQRAEELGYTPIISEVPEAGSIKGRFRCWRDALIAARLPSEKDPEQVRKRMEARKKSSAPCEKTD